MFIHITEVKLKKIMGIIKMSFITIIIIIIIMIYKRAFQDCTNDVTILLVSYRLLFLGHRSLIKNITQTAVINIFNIAVSCRI